MSKPTKMELAAMGSNFTISNGILGDMSSRLKIVDCENGRSTTKPRKGQYDRTGHEQTGNGHVQSDHPTSFSETFMHLLRGNIGAGIFGMGDAFKNGGIALAPFLTGLIGLVAVHCQHVLIRCAQDMRQIQNNANEQEEEMDDPDFAETVELCFLNGPPRLRPWSRFVKFLVNFFICLTQLGFCCIYIVFIDKNIEQLWDHYFEYKFDHFVKFAIILFPIMCISMITNLKFLAPLSTIANICMATGIAVTFYYLFQDLPSITERRAIGHLKDLPLFFGTAIFSFEGISLVLPLKNAMKKPMQFDRPAGVLNIGMIFVASLFIVVGFAGYWKYGEDVAGTITWNLPKEESLAQTVKLMVCVGLLLTYPLQFFVAIQIMWSSIEEKRGPLKHPYQTQLIFRALLVLVTFSLAEIVPQLNAFISLIGALCSSGLALVFPPVIQLVAAWGTSEGPTTWLLAKNSLILVLALFGLITGTYESLHTLAIAFRKK